MENGVCKTLDCPQGFEHVSIDSSQLYFEDLNENSELWLVRMPKSADVSSFENKQINIDGETYSVTTDDDTQYDCVADPRKIPNLCLLLPQTESKELSFVKNTFKGSIYVNEVATRSIPKVKVEQSDKDTRQSGLSVADLSLALNSTMEVDSSERPRKKNKKSHKKSKELGSNGFKEEPSSDLDGFPSCRSQTR